MTSFFGKLKSGTGATSPTAGSSPSKRDPNAPLPTPLERMLVNAGPIRNDGSDKFFGMENFGNTCYCNSMLQCLYYSVPFREQILNYPQKSGSDTIYTAAKTAAPRPAQTSQPALTLNKKPVVTPLPRNPNGTPQQPKPEDKDSPDYKKKQALAAGPVINMGYHNASAYGMPESLYTALKDIFEAVVIQGQRTGVVSPTRFLEMFKKENDAFRSAMHQDAHEFLNYLLNSIVETIKAHDEKTEAPRQDDGDNTQNSIYRQVSRPGSPNVTFPSVLPMPAGSASTWLNQLFEGTMTSETRCLTCENVSQRDEAFLDIPVDLEQHSSVTACLRRFSEEEMLCERNKFHCDNCGGLQEAEKRMKIKRLPKILALHLKRFKFTEDQQRLQKLFHKVVYPYHLRLFNTTDDAEDPDRLYELYAIVVHIGAGLYHGHYVAIIKTQDRGWLLFDDEMVEPVDKSYVRNFFGDRPGLACAYVLFYQETTLEAVQREQRMEGRPRASIDGQIGLGLKAKESAELHRIRSGPAINEEEGFGSLDHAVHANLPNTNGHVDTPKSPPLSALRPTSPVVQSKKEKLKDDKASKAADGQSKDKPVVEVEKRKGLVAMLAEARKKHEPELRAVTEPTKSTKADDDKDKENGHLNGSSPSGLDRFRRNKSLRFSSLTKKDKSDKPYGLTSSITSDESTSALVEEPATGDKDKEKEKKNRFSIRKKSFGVL